MGVKEYLRQARHLKKKIEYRQNQIIELQSMAGRTTGSCEALRVSGTSSRSKLEDAIIRIDSVAGKLANDVAKYAEAYQEISNAIEAVEDERYKELLTLYYLCFMTWEEVAVKMGKSWRWIMRMHQKSLMAIVSHIPPVL